MSKKTFIVELNTKYNDINEWLDDHNRKVRKKAIEEVEDKISEITWHHIHNGELVEGASSQDHEPLYKYSDIKKMLEQIKEQK